MSGSALTHPDPSTLSQHPGLLPVSFLQTKQHQINLQGLWSWVSTRPGELVCPGWSSAHTLRVDGTSWTGCVPRLSRVLAEESQGSLRRTGKPPWATGLAHSSLWQFRHLLTSFLFVFKQPSVWIFVPTLKADLFYLLYATRMLFHLVWAGALSHFDGDLSSELISVISSSLHIFSNLQTFFGKICLYDLLDL